MRTLKKILTYAVAVLPLAMPAMAKADVSILVYHHVSETTPPSTTTSPDLFRDQLDLIEELGMEVVHLEAATSKALNGYDDDKLRVALTFDDAYESVYTKAWPKLRERNIPFTLFVTTDALDDGTSGYMSWDEVRELAEHELVTIGNHTSDHGALIRRPDESSEELEKRVAASLDDADKRLEEELGISPELFAHPYGEFSDTLTQALKEREWYGFAQHSGVMGEQSDPRNIPRFPVADAFGGIDTLRDKLRARNFPVPYDELPSPVIGEKNPPKLAMPLPEGWDHGRLTCFAPREGAMEKDVREDNDRTIVTVQANNRLDNRRSRYNCTYPAGGGRFYWLSQPWFNKEAPEG